MMDRDLVGFSNDAYDNTVEWEELKIKSSNAQDSHTRPTQSQKMRTKMR